MPESLNHQLLMAWYSDAAPALAMPDDMKSLLFTAPAGGQYIQPTCAADLSTGSDAQLALEAATYPSEHRQVRWFPIVGISTEGAGSAPVQATLWELLFNWIPGIPLDQTEISALNPRNSDLIVPADSQRNSYLGSANELAGQDFEQTAHVFIAETIQGETSRAEIAIKVGALLSGWPTKFNTSWRLSE